MKLYLQRKGRAAKDRYLIIEGEIEQVIRRYLATRDNPPASAPLFASFSDKNAGQRLTTRTISRIAKEGLRRIGLNSKFYTAHSLRHSFVTFSVLAGNSLQGTQTLAGHASPDMTMIYFHDVNSGLS